MGLRDVFGGTSLQLGGRATGPPMAALHSLIILMPT